MSGRWLSRFAFPRVGRQGYQTSPFVGLVCMVYDAMEIFQWVAKLQRFSVTDTNADARFSLRSLFIFS